MKKVLSVAVLSLCGAAYTFGLSPPDTLDTQQKVELVAPAAGQVTSSANADYIIENCTATALGDVSLASLNPQTVFNLDNAGPPGIVFPAVPVSGHLLSEKGDRAFAHDRVGQTDNLIMTTLARAALKGGSEFAAKIV